MSCKKECMHKHACCVHLCRRAGCCQAGLGAGTVSLALNMRARGMAYCMRIENGMRKAACMPNSRHGDYLRSPPSLSENRRNRRVSESEGKGGRACHKSCYCNKMREKACRCMLKVYSMRVRMWYRLRRAVLPVHIASKDALFPAERVASSRSITPAQTENYMATHAHG